MKKACLLVVASWAMSIALGGSARAQDAIARLRGNSLRVSVDYSVEVTGGSSGRSGSATARMELGIYVSTAGRLFVQGGRDMGLGRSGTAHADITRVTQVGVSHPANFTNVRSSGWAVQGSSLAQIRVFSQSYQLLRIEVSGSGPGASCSASLSYNSASGGPTLVPRASNGELVELLSYRVNGSSCQVVSGNIFGT